MRMNAVYARQSVDKADSISIESQIEFCKYELKGESCEAYTDKGYSGKNTERPAFQQMMADIKAGKIGRVVVYKLDRISRSILDFATMMDVFQAYNVDFVSSTEKFDTSTPMGRAMLNICIVFAQLERETIQKRVADAYKARAAKGFYMGGAVPRGFMLEPCVIDGIHTKRMIPDPETAPLVQQAFKSYAKPGGRYRDIVRLFLDHGYDISPNGVVHMMGNPLYARADIEVYNYLVSQGAQVVSPPEFFTGVNGCYLYRDTKTVDNPHNLEGVSIVVAPSEGLVDSDLWIACCKKMRKNQGTPMSGSRPKYSWLIGKVICGACGTKMKHEKGYFVCNRKRQGRCTGPHTTVRVKLFEEEALRLLKEKLGPLTITGYKPKENPKKASLKLEIAKVDKEINELIDSLSGANAILISYANTKIEALDEKRQRLSKELADLVASETSPEEIILLNDKLGKWDEMDNATKMAIVNTVLISITVKDGEANFEWRI